MWNAFNQVILPVLTASAAAHSPSSLCQLVALALALLSLRHDYGFHYRDINICEKIFVACCCLNNFLLD
jgi:hypothetical protein